MSKSTIISKTFVAANVIYSHRSAGQDVLVSTFVYDQHTNIRRLFFSVVGISRNR